MRNENSFELRILFRSARTAVLEIVDGGRYETLRPYRICVNGEAPFETKRTINNLFGLKPDSAVTVRVRPAASPEEAGTEGCPDEGREEVSVSFHTEYESVSLNVKDFGAKGDGVSDDTLFLQTAVWACPKDGRVVVPAGTYRFTCLQLKSFLKLHLEKGAVLKAFTDEARLPLLPGTVSYYDETDEYNLGSWEGNPLPMRMPLVSGLNAENILLSGEGIIDGAASHENWWRKERVKALPARPRLFFLSHCRNVAVQGLCFQNSPSWTIHPYFSEELAFYGTRVFNPAISPNTDGLDPESCSDVRIVGMHFSLGDDCIAIKSGKIYMARKLHTPSQKMIIRQCLLENGHGAVTIGSEIAGGVRDVTVEDCIFRHTDRGLRIKTRRGRGKDSVLDAISFRRINMEEVLTPFVINSFYYCDPDGHTSYVSDRSALPVDERTPAIGKVCFEQIDCRGAHVRAVHIEGLPENKIEEAVFRNVSIRMSDRPQKGLAAMAEGVEESCAGGMFIRNVHRLVLDHVQIEGTTGPACDLDQIDRIEEGHS